MPFYGAGDVRGDKFDEAGYIALADCLWGAAAYGLEAPSDLEAARGAREASVAAPAADADARVPHG